MTSVANLGDLVLVTTKNMDSDSRTLLMNSVTADLCDLELLKIHSYKVTAEMNPHKDTENFQIKIVASAYGKEFVKTSRSKTCPDIELAYRAVQSDIKKEILAHKDVLVHNDYIKRK